VRSTNRSFLRSMRGAKTPIEGRRTPKKKARGNDRKPELSVRAATGARHLHPSDNTPTTLSRGLDGRGSEAGERDVKSDEENRARGFSPRVALAAECRVDRAKERKRERERERDRVGSPASYGRSYGLVNVAGEMGGSLPSIARVLPSLLQRGIFPRHPRREGDGETVAGARAWS